MCQNHDSFLPLYLQRDCPDTAPCSAPALPVISGCWNRTPWSQRVFCARCGYQVVSRWISAVGSAVAVCRCAELCVLRCRPFCACQALARGLAAAGAPRAAAGPHGRPARSRAAPGRQRQPLLQHADAASASAVCSQETCRLGSWEGEIVLPKKLP